MSDRTDDRTDARADDGICGAEATVAALASTAGRGPLRGWRVLVPRPTAGQSGAAVALAAAGAAPELVPLIAIDPPEETGPLDDALLALGAGWYRWLVVTSGAAVPVLADRAAAAGRTLAALVADGRTQVAAVGPGTARALAEADVATDLTPRGPSTGAALAAQWPPAPPAEPGAGTDAAAGDERPARVLFARGDLAASTVADGLRARGWQVDEVVAYRTVTAPPPPDDVRDDWRAGRIRAALLTSASTVRALVEHLGAPPAGTLLVAIGPTTAAEARRRGLPLAATADEQTMSALVAALARAAADAPDPNPDEESP
ncbi:uroporphyrinogen-III synthase [Cellulomonas sp. DKR-3]|uniref:Uroporphyrinogen-III synthase n=1 Tax=Cellulomonas fulva TaxID=2835530 RepID=A0ABS5TWT5_9CELL|nr:uroporphyrinogen-III synthase [Cellulomonas fulva]MBT0993611.1 uroporphyrinogen-III synthase [Cellulomonas fulva]